MEVAIGQEDVTDPDTVGILAGLFFAGQRVYSSVFRLQQSHRLIVAVKQQIVSKANPDPASRQRLFAVTPTRCLNHLGDFYPRSVFGCHCLTLRYE